MSNEDNGKIPVPDEVQPLDGTEGGPADTSTAAAKPDPVRDMMERTLARYEEEDRQNARSQRSWGIALVISFAVLAAVLSVTVPRDRQLAWGCVEYLERAASASTVVTAERHLSVALRYLERRGLTRGSTAYFRPSVGDDIGVWYRNLRDARDELRALPSGASRLEVSNVLIRAREVITDQEGGVAYPGALANYPYHRQLLVTKILSGIAFLGSFFGYLWARLRRM